MNAKPRAEAERAASGSCNSSSVSGTPAGGPGRGGHGFPAQRGLGGGIRGLAKQAFRRELSGSRAGSQAPQDFLRRGFEFVVGVSLGDQSEVVRFLGGDHRAPRQPGRRLPVRRTAGRDWPLRGIDEAGVYRGGPGHHRRRGRSSRAGYPTGLPRSVGTRMRTKMLVEAMVTAADRSGGRCHCVR